jgi:hypothetical protein
LVHISSYFTRQKIYSGAQRHLRRVLASTAPFLSPNHRWFIHQPTIDWSNQSSAPAHILSASKIHFANRGKPPQNSESIPMSSSSASNGSLRTHSHQLNGGVHSSAEHLLQLSLEPNQYNNLDYFELSGKLGKGQFSEVLRAKNRLTGKMVALKKIEVSTVSPNSTVVF